MTTLTLAKDEDWRVPGRTLSVATTRGWPTSTSSCKRSTGNAKFTTADWLLRFILPHAGANLPLRQTVALGDRGRSSATVSSDSSPKANASPPAITVPSGARGADGRMDVQETPGVAPCYSMVLVDATTLCGPGATSTDARIHTKLRAADVSVQEAIVTDLHGGETLKRFLVQTR